MRIKVAYPSRTAERLVARYFGQTALPPFASRRGRPGSYRNVRRVARRHCPCQQQQGPSEIVGAKAFRLFLIEPIMSRSVFALRLVAANADGVACQPPGKFQQLCKPPRVGFAQREGWHLATTHAPGRTTEPKSAAHRLPCWSTSPDFPNLGGNRAAINRLDANFTAGMLSLTAARSKDGSDHPPTPVSRPGGGLR